MKKELGQKKFLANNHGFTLIELLVTTSLAVLLLLSASAILMTFMIGSNKNNLALRVKSEGNNALNQINFLLRNAVDIEPCDLDMNEIVITSKDTLQTTLRVVSDENENNRPKIASEGANGTFFLTSGQNTLPPSEPLIFNCQTSNNMKFIETQFTLQQGSNPSANQSDKENEVQTFRSSVTVRNP